MRRARAGAPPRPSGRRVVHARSLPRLEHSQLTAARPLPLSLPSLPTPLGAHLQALARVRCARSSTLPARRGTGALHLPSLTLRVRAHPDPLAPTRALPPADYLCDVSDSLEVEVQRLCEEQLKKVRGRVSRGGAASAAKAAGPTDTALRAEVASGADSILDTMVQAYELVGDQFEVYARRNVFAWPEGLEYPVRVRARRAQLLLCNPPPHPTPPALPLHGSAHWRRAHLLWQALRGVL